MKKNDIFASLWEYFTPHQITKILEKITGFSKNQLFFSQDLDITQEILEEYITKKKQKIPFEYIIESSTFFGREFYVDNNVLIPRDDTEILVEAVLSESKKHHSLSLIHIGSGSWCIGITLAKELSNIEKQYAIDISPKALKITQKNAKKYDCQNNIFCLEWSLFCLTWEQINELWWVICITANLPYIKKNDFDNMDENVYLHEPELALYGWEKTGFELYEILTDQLIELKQKYPNKKILSWCEIGFDQYEYSKKFLSQKWLKFEYFQDMAKIHRCIQIEF